MANLREEETVTLNGEEIARVIELAFDHGWEHGRDTSPGQLGFDGALGNAKWQINQWLIDNGFLV